MKTFQQFNESTIEQKSMQWVKAYGSEDKAILVLYNIKDQIIHILSDLKSIRKEAYESHEEIKKMGVNGFMEWIVNTFTNDLRKAQWPEAHSKGLTEILMKRIHEPLMKRKRIV
jgi:hypothetical protein